MSWEGGMVRGVLATWDFVGEIALRVQIHPPGTESPSRYVMTLRVREYPRGRLLLVSRCFVLAELLS